MKIVGTLVGQYTRCLKPEQLPKMAALHLDLNPISSQFHIMTLFESGSYDTFEQGDIVIYADKSEDVTSFFNFIQAFIEKVIPDGYPDFRFDSVLKMLSDIIGASVKLLECVDDTHVWQNPHCPMNVLESQVLPFFLLSITPQELEELTSRFLIAHSYC